jgi:LPS-assembly lipoprotein
MVSPMNVMRMNRRTALKSMMALPLAGCGFRPLYGQKDGGAAVDLSLVSVVEQNNRPGQLVRNELLRAMTGTGDRYAVRLAVTEKERLKSSLTGTQTVRYDLTLNGKYELVDSRSGKSLSKGGSFSTVSYDIVREPLADMQARDAAAKRAAIELANDIRLRVAVYFSAQTAG